MKTRSMLSNKEIEWAYTQWCLGYTQLQIAEALYCSDHTISKTFKKRGLQRIRPVLKAPKELYE